MTPKLLHSGFDSLDIAFKGALPERALQVLEEAKELAQETKEPSLIDLGPGKIAMHVAESGKPGGYRFRGDTGPIGEWWAFKKSTNINEWNIFVSVRAASLLEYGFEGVCTRLQNSLKGMGAIILEESVNRIDYAMDFQLDNFEPKPEQFVAHQRCKLKTYYGPIEGPIDDTSPRVVTQGRKVQSITIGTMPGRQIILYDKRREVIDKRKLYWFDAWRLHGDDRDRPVWRVEIRAGKSQLKDSWNIRSLDDVRNSICDVLKMAMEEVRYVNAAQYDANVTRQLLHPLWATASAHVVYALQHMQSGLLPGRIIEVEREVKQQLYLQQILGLLAGWSVTLGLSDTQVMDDLSDILTATLDSHLRHSGRDFEEARFRAMRKLRFYEEMVSNK